MLFVKWADGHHQRAALSVPVTDRARARHFYRDSLDFELARDDPVGPLRHPVDPDGNGIVLQTTAV